MKTVGVGRKTTPMDTKIKFKKRHKKELSIRGVQLRTVLKYVLIARRIAPQAAIKESFVE